MRGTATTPILYGGLPHRWSQLVLCLSLFDYIGDVREYSRRYELQDAWPRSLVRIPFTAEEPGVRPGGYFDDRHRCRRNHRNFFSRKLRTTAAAAVQECRSTARAYRNRPRAESGGSPGFICQAPTPATKRAYA